MTTGGAQVRGIDVVFYGVKDMARARRFYEGLFGLKAGVESDYWVEYELPDGTTFALGMDPRQEWQAYRGIMFGVEDLDAAVKKAAELGATFSDLPFEGEKCHAKMLYDTEGNMLVVHAFK